MNEDREAERILGNLTVAVAMAADCPDFARLMPEVRVNLVFARSEAQTPAEVAGVDGRITVVQGRPHASGLLRWGVSDHMARLIIEMRKYEPGINAGINFKYDHAVEKVAREYCAEKGLRFGWIDRTHEPEEIARPDGSSIPWKVKQAITSAGGVPRLFFEGDGWGKEPLFFAVGTEATEVAEIAIQIARRYCRLETGKGK